MPLILRRASISRSSGQWLEDDYNVYAGQRNVGRIFKADAGHPAETPWMGTILFRERRPPDRIRVSRCAERGDGRVQGELGARATMNRRDKQIGRTVASTKRQRSVKLSGHKTSIKLEEPFWQAIGEIAQARGCSISALIRSVAAKRVDGNLSSTVRVFVLERFRAAGQKETKA